MFLPRTSVLATATLLLKLSLATVPDVLSQEFSTELQVNFNGDSSDGFNDGDTIPFSDTANNPVFALGDSSGVNTARSYMIMMLDTTDEQNFVMHFFKTDYKATGKKTGLASSATPKVPYTAPGAAAETGERQYSFLLYMQKSGSELVSPAGAGEKFDYDAFMQSNDIDPAVAGVEMNVVLGDDTAAQAAPPPPSPPAVTSASSTLVTMASTYPTGAWAPGDAYGNGSGDSSDDDAMTMQNMPEGIHVGGGVVTEQPFPAEVADQIAAAISPADGDGEEPKPEEPQPADEGDSEEVVEPEELQSGPVEDDSEEVEENEDSGDKEDGEVKSMGAIDVSPDFYRSFKA